MFLSQPPSATNPSKPCAPATVSIESAITSRDTSEKRMPGEPIEIPSETVIVLKMRLMAPAPSAASAAALARPSRCTLHGVMFDQVLAMPIEGFSKSPSA